MRLRKLPVPYPLLRLAYRAFDVEKESLPPGLRMAEYSWCISKIVQFPVPGRALDVGCTAIHNVVPAVFAFLGWEAYGIDRRPLRFCHPNFHFVQEDIRNTSFSNDFFDCVTAISTLEHIGMQGFYGERERDPEGDAKAVEEIRRILKPRGLLLVTVPFAEVEAIDNEWGGVNRYYDEKRLQKVFRDFTWKEELFYVVSSDDSLEPVSVEEAKQSRDAAVFLELEAPK